MMMLLEKRMERDEYIKAVVEKSTKYH